MTPRISKTILIVEDEQIIAHSIQRSLSKAGFSVAGMATSAAEAFELIEQTNPHLVLMDIHIQGPIDGVEAAKTIKERYQLPVIYLTAHADAATLDRAKFTEPLGYLVKPLDHANLPTAVEIALYKHRMDRQLDENRAMLSAILQTIPEAVVVIDSEGEVQFLNQAAEELTEWTQSQAVGKPFENIVVLEDTFGLPTLLQVLRKGDSVQLPRETVLRTRENRPVAVDGHIAVSLAAGRTAGAIITLHDATLRRREERQIRQEQKMLSVGQLANDVAQDFYGLFDLIARSGDDLLEEDGSGETVKHSAGLMKQVGNLGASMARQLLDFGKDQALRPEALDLNQVIEEKKILYDRLCGRSICLETSLSPVLDRVLSHSIHLEKLALNLVLSGKQTMPHGGKIFQTT